jgi:hypothetical protein
VPASPPGNSRNFDVYFSIGGRRFYFRNPNHGVTLSDDGIAWSVDGRDDHAAFANIRTIHLQSGGDWRNTIDQCRLEFADGMSLAVTNGNSLGMPEDRQIPLYRAFVRDLHRRAVAANTAIRFSAGYPPGRYWTVFVGAILLGLMFVGIPLVMLIITADMKILALLLTGCFFCWPLAKMVRNNAPRDYSPNSLPDELLR